MSESLRTPLLAAEPPDAAGSQQGDDAAAGDGTQTNVTGAEPTHKAALRAGSMLGQMCERSLIEHQLAASHFAVLNFWGFFLPLNLLIAIGSVLAFLGDPDKGIISDNSFISSYGNIIVGCIGALSVFISSIERLLNYKSRTDMHDAAKQILKDQLLNLDFALLRFQSLPESARSSSDSNPFNETALNEIKAKLDHVQESCTSAVPNAISQAFKRLNTMVTYDLDIKGLDKASRGDVQILRIANVLLCHEITVAWNWPMVLPRGAFVERAMEKLETVICDHEEKERKEKEKEKKKEEAAQAAQASQATNGEAALGTTQLSPSA